MLSMVLRFDLSTHPRIQLSQGRLPGGAPSLERETPSEGRDAFRELWSRTFEGRTGVNPLEVEVRGSIVEGDLAVVRADYGPEGRDPVGQYVWTLVRSDDDAWRPRWWIFTREAPGA